MREEPLLARLRTLFAGGDPSVVTGSGPDDCAHVLADSTRLALTIDSFAEGSHFLADTPAGAVAEKAVSATISDLAASGCRARWLLASLCLRRGLPEGWAAEFAAGLAATSRRYNVSVVGGDTTSGPAVFVTMAAVGEPLPGGPLLRSGAREGDVLAVTGSLGGSLTGRHLHPVPRLEEIRRILALCTDRALPPPSAAMDISDGLALDLSRLCRESGVGARLEAARIPVADAAREMAERDGRGPLAHALADGEDFELLIAIPPRTWREVAAAQPGPAPLTEIGVVTAGPDITITGDDGITRQVPAEGYQHQW